MSVEAEEQPLKRQKLAPGEEEEQKEDEEIELFSYWRSSCSWRVRLALALKGIEYKYSAVHLVEGNQKSEAYSAMNPMQQVPALKINGSVLTQSTAIIEYLEERYPEPALLPKDLIQRSQVRKIVQIINSGIQPIQNLKILGKVQDVGGDKMAWGKEVIEEGFVALEKEIAAIPGRKEGDFCIGDSVTMADLFLVPQVYNANRFSVNMERFPLIASINEKLGELPAFKKAHPSVQPDAPTEST